MPVTASNGFDLLRKKDGGAQANQVCLKMGYTPTWLSKWGTFLNWKFYMFYLLPVQIFGGHTHGCPFQQGIGHANGVDTGVTNAVACASLTGSPVDTCKR